MPPLGGAPRPALDLAALRSRLSGATGPSYWRSLEELAATPEFGELLAREFPAEAAAWRAAPDRRDFLKIMGAALALAGLAGCAERPAETILPYVRMPEFVVPGRPLWFATVMPRNGYGLGVLAESHMGRPVKIEGNPGHPGSLGATDACAQASILELYDPERSQGVLHRGRISTWTTFLDRLLPLAERLAERKGDGIRILTDGVTSPTTARQMRLLLGRFPEARWHVWSPAGHDAPTRGARLAFGRPLAERYRVREADVLLALDADLLTSGPGALRYAREWAERRTPGDGRMNRLYAVESTPTLTGGRADHRRAVRASDVGPIAARLAVAVKEDRPLDDAWLEALRKDLMRHRGTSLVVAGGPQPPDVLAQAHLLNALLGNAGRTVVYTEPVEARPAEGIEDLRALVEDMRNGRVQMLLVLGGNPVYTAPPSLGFGEALEKVPLTAHLGLYVDETSLACRWHVPATHYLESWSDARAFDGTASIQQPLIAPLYGGRSVHELLAALAGRPGLSAYEAVRETWQERLDADGWARALHDGIVAGTELSPVDVSPRPDLPEPAAAPRDGLELVFRPDPYVDDGRHAENAWLQELPRPLTHLSWDNALLVAPATAEALKLSSGEVVEARVGSRSLKVPAWILPGLPAGSAMLHLGFGRAQGGRVARGVGVNAYLLRDAEPAGFVHGLEIRRTGERRRLACTQDHWTLAGRDLVRAAPIETYREHPEIFQGAAHPAGEPPSLYPDLLDDAPRAWGMVIDLNVCTGCSACMVACQAENNVPTVGKEGVLNGREMYWLRIDRYFEGDVDDPRMHFQPMLCQHCEKAPCEVVCPTNATVHSDEGLNQMVYNRCVGTRYCSNNCPYKVRRFNFFQYADWDTPALKLMRNPEVSVRERGVMEKCTYCVQRIERAKIEAATAGRPVGQIQTACAQACPVEAITFGDLRDAGSAVVRRKAEPRNYGVLAELGTRPRTTYLGRLLNPNPEIAAE